MPIKLAVPRLVPAMAESSDASHGRPATFFLPGTPFLPNLFDAVVLNEVTSNEKDKHKVDKRVRHGADDGFVAVVSRRALVSDAPAATSRPAAQNRRRRFGT